jgi:transcriptional regulator GlxA family with amidase domain
MMERTPYTIAEVAHMLRLSAQTITRLFEKEPGVIILERKKPNRKRKSYRSIRIPHPVFERVRRSILV